MNSLMLPPLHYGFHRPAPVAFSAAPVPAAALASRGQWPASPAIRPPSPTARPPNGAEPWCAGTTTTPVPPFPKLPSSSPPVLSGPALAPTPAPALPNWCHPSLLTLVSGGFVFSGSGPVNIARTVADRKSVGAGNGREPC